MGNGRTQHQERRMVEVKAAAEALFAQHPYSQITLTSIAEQLSWTRANLYKYASTKEEIFLELCADKRDAYFDALEAAFPATSSYPLDVFAQVWAEILNANSDHLRYYDLLLSIFETNVSIEKLADYKRGYFERADRLDALFGKLLGVDTATANKVFSAVQFHAVGLFAGCGNCPLAAAAMEMIGREKPTIDFKEEMRGFILIMLKAYAGQSSKPALLPM